MTRLDRTFHTPNAAAAITISAANVRTIVPAAPFFFAAGWAAGGSGWAAAGSGVAGGSTCSLTSTSSIGDASRDDEDRVTLTSFARPRYMLAALG
jgi:hypothetical protein